MGGRKISRVADSLPFRRRRCAGFFGGTFSTAASSSVRPERFQIINGRAAWEEFVSPSSVSQIVRGIRYLRNHVFPKHHGHFSLNNVWLHAPVAVSLTAEDPAHSNQHPSQGSGKTVRKKSQAAVMAVTESVMSCCYSFSGPTREFIPSGYAVFRYPRAYCSPTGAMQASFTRFIRFRPGQPDALAGVRTRGARGNRRSPGYDFDDSSSPSSSQARLR